MKHELDIECTKIEKLKSQVTVQFASSLNGKQIAVFSLVTVVMETADMYVPGNVYKITLSDKLESMKHG